VLAPIGRPAPVARRTGPPPAGAEGSQAWGAFDVFLRYAPSAEHDVAMRLKPCEPVAVVDRVACAVLR